MQSSQKKWTKEEVLETFGEDIACAGTDEIEHRSRLIENEIHVFKNEKKRIQYDETTMKEKIKENTEKIKLNKQLPYLVATVVEILETDENEEIIQDGSSIALDEDKKGKSAVIKTSTRQTIYLPVIGLVDSEQLKPGELVGVNKDSFLVLEKLPSEYDSRVKAMEVDERPKEDYDQIGGCDAQIKEMYEAIVLPMTEADRFKKIGIQPPKGVLLYGPPGTGKTLLARACAAQTKATFLKLAGPQLVQMFIGDGAKLRFGSDKSGDREVQRTMLELLNQMDGFSQDTRVKVIAATNRIDILDPALLRSGRLDRKIEFPLPDEKGRIQILKIHSKRMNVNFDDVNYEELARCCEDFNGAQLKAVCVEAGMIALRRDATQIMHEDFMEGIAAVQAKKKVALDYYA
ncbi:hypothetical protein FDP41_007475 [Naegleria fowleri]|uniref:AAA+ ATPase domain-containing protein n=1 Tax=Naegleria fowleri TaxID=5763 RepID=A0A6A5CG27_NAEFO|nr:uncharacterized protein FDP41_007475 [Naegleria fowleri]KAF0984298.1 hypothetical protein FDP41_007475 [Naegleria fowleri]